MKKLKKKYIKTDHLKYLTCNVCETTRPDGELREDYCRLSIAVTPKGHLLVMCTRHDEQVAYVENQDLSSTLLKVSQAPCACKHKHKETMH